MVVTSLPLVTRFLLAICYRCDHLFLPDTQLRDGHCTYFLENKLQIKIHAFLVCKVARSGSSLVEKPNRAFQRSHRPHFAKRAHITTNAGGIYAISTGFPLHVGHHFRAVNALRSPRKIILIQHRRCTDPSEMLRRYCTATRNILCTSNVQQARQTDTQIHKQKTD